MVITFPSNSCEEVEAEISSRIMNPSWIDPHNAGKYSLRYDKGLSDGGDNIIQGERITGDKKYTDKFMMTFLPGSMMSSGTCRVMACSESQVFSILDFSTNYCNLRNLYCNEKEDLCVMEKNDLLDYEEEYVKCEQNVKDKCIVATSSQ